MRLKVVREMNGSAGRENAFHLDHIAMVEVIVAIIQTKKIVVSLSFHFYFQVIIYV